MSPVWGIKNRIPRRESGTVIKMFEKMKIITTAVSHKKVTYYQCQSCYFYLNCHGVLSCLKAISNQLLIRPTLNMKLIQGRTTYSNLVGIPRLSVSCSSQLLSSPLSPVISMLPNTNESVRPLISFMLRVGRAGSRLPITFRQERTPWHSGGWHVCCESRVCTVIMEYCAKSLIETVLAHNH